MKVISYFIRPDNTLPDEFPLYTRYVYPYDTNIKEILLNDLKQNIESLTTTGSGWAFAHFTALYLHIPLINISRGGTYIKLPAEIVNKRAILNLDNSKENDNRCFLWSILA